MENVCDECGKPATYFSRDLTRRDGGLGYWEFALAEARPIRLGCDEHQPCSDTVHIDDLVDKTVQHDGRLYAVKYGQSPS